MTFRAPGRAPRAAQLAAIPAALGLFALFLFPRDVRADVTSAPLKNPVAATNAQLLQSAVQAVARKLVGGAPITPGTRVGLRAESDQPLDSDVAEALLQALNARRISCVMLAAAPGPADAPAVAAPTGPGGSAAPTKPGGGAPAASATGGLAAGLGAFAQLQAERLSQAAAAESIAKAAGSTTTSGAATPSVLASGVGGDMTVISYRVAEARVDYVRQFRGGLFGAQRIERRASARIALRMTSPGSDAVAWSASADTSVGDVVLRSEIAALEDRTRPETRPVAPSSGISKIVEPVLVIVLIAGLVSLFYQNRP